MTCSSAAVDLPASPHTPRAAVIDKIRHFAVSASMSSPIKISHFPRLDDAHVNIMIASPKAIRPIVADSGTHLTPSSNGSHRCDDGGATRGTPRSLTIHTANNHAMSTPPNDEPKSENGTPIVTPSSLQLAILRAAATSSASPSPPPIMPVIPDVMIDASPLPSPTTSPRHQTAEPEPLALNGHANASNGTSNDSHSHNGAAAVTECKDDDTETNSLFSKHSHETHQLKFMYKVYHHICDLFFAVDKELDNLPEKRVRTNTNASNSNLAHIQANNDSDNDVDNLRRAKSNKSKKKGKNEEVLKEESTAGNSAINSIPITVSPGYGELARAGFDKVLQYMMFDAPESARLDADCSFLDIGSGFGKCVLHAKVRAKVRQSRGIEYIPLRHEKALETLHLLNAKFVPGLTDTHTGTDASNDSDSDNNVASLLRDLDLTGVELIKGDITEDRHTSLLYQATHIYMFDVVFSELTMEVLLPMIEKTNFAMFACYHRPSYLEKLGCRQFVLVHKMAMRTTGGQSFTCYFYIKSGAMRRNTRSKDIEIQQLRKREKEIKAEKLMSALARTTASGKKRKKKSVSKRLSNSKKSKRKIPMEEIKDDDMQDDDEQQNDAEEEEDDDGDDNDPPVPKRRKSNGPTGRPRGGPPKTKTAPAKPRSQSKKFKQSLPEPEPESESVPEAEAEVQEEGEEAEPQEPPPPPVPVDYVRSSTRTSEATMALQASAAASEATLFLALAWRLMDEYDAEMQEEKRTAKQEAKLLRQRESEQSMDVGPNTDASNVSREPVNKSLATRLLNAQRLREVLSMRHHYLDAALPVAVNGVVRWIQRKGVPPKDGEQVLHGVWNTEPPGDYRWVGFYESPPASQSSSPTNATTATRDGGINGIESGNENLAADTTE